MSKYESQYIEANGLNFHVKVAGSEGGELVVLLHGFPEFWYGWKNQIDVLADAGYRVVVPDQRGYNKSDKPESVTEYHIDKLADDVVEIILHFNVDSAIIIGHDWGGAVGWHLASTVPEAVQKFIAINIPHPAVMPEVMKRHPKQIFKSLYMLFFQIPKLPEKILNLNDYKNMKRALKQSSNENTFSRTDLNEYEKAWSRNGSLTGMLNWYRAVPVSLNSLEKKVGVPVQIIWGVGDQFLSKELAEESFKLLDSGNIAWIENATHWVNHEQPDMVNRHILRFLDE